MQVSYCDRWNTKLGKPIGRMTAEAARERDRTCDRWYTVVVGEPVRPDCYLEIVWENAHVGVWFLDPHGRAWLHYSFTRVDSQRLFLDSAARWEYPRGAGRRLSEADVIETISYRQDGRVHQEIVDKKTDDVSERDYAHVPLDINWEPVPRFGDYRSLARLDRELAVG